MRNQRALIRISAVTAVMVRRNILNFTVSTNRFNESYPAVVCPPNTNGLSTAISLTSPNTLARKTGSPSMKSKEVGFRRYAVVAQSAVVEAGKVTPLVWQVRKGVWAGAI